MDARELGLGDHDVSCLHLQNKPGLGVGARDLGLGDHDVSCLIG